MSIVITPIPSTIELAAPAFTLGSTNTAGAAVTAVASNSTIATWGTPTVGLGTAFSAGSAATGVRTDATLLAFDTTIPTVTAQGSPSVGSATVAGRRDHVHGFTAGLVLINTAAADDSANLTLTGITSTYDTYLIAISDCLPATNGADPWLRLGDSVAGINSGASDYSWHVASHLASSDAYSAVVSTGSTHIRMSGPGAGDQAGEGFGATLFIHTPGDATMLPSVSGAGINVDASTAANGLTVSGVRNSVITVDRVQFLFSSGIITSGRMTLWGLNHTAP